MRLRPQKLKRESISFRFSQAPEGSSVIWTVVPFDNVQINPTGNVATIQFSNAGVYYVKASYSNFKGSAEVSVLDSIYNPGGGGTPTYQPLTGDQIFITVSKYDSMGLGGLSPVYHRKEIQLPESYASVR